MTTRIIVDSTADLVPEIKERVHIVPLTVHFGDEEYIDDGEVLDKNRLGYISDSFREAFSGKDIYFEMENAYCTDWMIAIESGVGEVYFHGEDDGPYNGYDPDIAANIFSMQEEKDYFLYINDRFGQDDATSELYIDLKKVSIS